MIMAIIQARMGSSRLPGKVLMDLAGETVLFRVVERVRRCQKVDRVVVATTLSKSDDPIETLCVQKNVGCFRGSEEDVLDRYFQCALHFGAQATDAIVRITADCPLLDPAVVDHVVQRFLSTSCAYASNINPPTFPDGLDVEVFSHASLQRAWKEARMASEREHVTVYIRNHPEWFASENVQNREDWSHLRWTLDEPEDYHMLSCVFSHFATRNMLFGMEEVLDFLKDNPDVQRLNRKFLRNEGLQKSLDNDHEVCPPPPHIPAAQEKAGGQN